MSGAVDEDVARTVNEGRETLGAMLRAAQKHLQKVFILFVLGLVGTIYFLRKWGWERMQADLNVNKHIQVVAVTPFDVILLQVKIGLVVGILVALPLLLYYSRDALKERGIWPTGVPRWKLGLGVVFSLSLFLGGAAYGYVLFFPLAFDFLASNAVQAGFKPTYSIVKWAEFIFLLMISFGLAAQLPLAMSTLAYLEIVPYRTFRDYWKHAVVILYAIGALFTPPDPLTQLMWATPLVVLYGLSLALTKFIVTAKASSERIGVGRVAREKWNVLLGTGFLVGAGSYVAGRAALSGQFDPALATLADTVGLGAPSLAADRLLGLPATRGLALLALVLGLLAMGGVLVWYLFSMLDEVAATEALEGTGPAPSSTGSPASIDVGELDAGGVRAAPVEAFTEMTEEEALSLASDAMEADEPDRAQAILDRFDETQETMAASPVEKGASAEMANHVDEEGRVQEPEEESDVVTRTGAGILNAFTEEELDEEDVGGYYYDFAFILDSLTSRAFRIVGLFMAVLASVFFVLYKGGIGYIKRDFLSRLPAGVTPDQVSLVTLHPVEALIFEIKVSTVAAVVVTLPLLLYYAWPALKERGLAGGDRRVLLLWGGTLLGGIVLGSFVGYAYIAPTVISWLAADVIQANMVIAYRITNFGWLVFFTTAGVGLLLDIPLTMLLFHSGGLVTYESMRDRWREVTITVFAVVALLSPQGVFMMFLIGIPVMLVYAFGLALLWVSTLGGRRGGGGSPTAETTR